MLKIQVFVISPQNQTPGGGTLDSVFSKSPAGISPARQSWRTNHWCYRLLKWIASFSSNNVLYLRLPIKTACELHMCIIPVINLSVGQRREFIIVPWVPRMVPGGTQLNIYEWTTLQQDHILKPLLVKSFLSFNSHWLYGNRSHKYSTPVISINLAGSERREPSPA